MKIIDKINASVERQEVFYSFEFFPPKTPAGVDNLYARMDRMAALEPLFCDMTWGAGGSSAQLTLELSANAQKLSGLEMLMHMTCTNMAEADIKKALDQAKDAGIQNILALRGDPVRGATSFDECDRGFSHAVDLVRYIREKYGDHFCIGVAGYPRLFYDVQVFVDFVKECRAVGITVPIIPGIMPIQNYGGFERMTSFCNTTCLRSRVPRRELPWQTSTLSKRASESVRPIYWSNRPKSYVHRTAMWDEYPNGRWGNSESPAFGELTESHFAPSNTSTPRERRAMWGEAPASKEDVRRTFVQYVRGEISSLPWCDAALHAETSTVQQELAAANSAGFLTINSQPRVNGALSDDPMFGWGGPGGRVYQKAYVECFVSPENMKIIIDNAAKKPSLQYHAVNLNGHSYSNASKSAVAVTWGVFPNKEILQPTIVDSSSFLVWKDEAFTLWLKLWASLYEQGSQSAKLLREIHDTYFLVSIVDNDFVNGNIWDLFEASVSPATSPIQTHFCTNFYLEQSKEHKLMRFLMKEVSGVPSVCVRELHGHQGPSTPCASTDKTVKLWNPHRGGVEKPNEALLVKSYEGRHGYDVQDVAMCGVELKAHDNNKFASCGRDKDVFMWDVPTAKVIRKFEGHVHSVNCVRYNADSSVLLSGSYDKTIRAWDIRARNAYTPIQVLDDFRDSVTSMVVTDHEIIAGLSLICRCVDGVVRTYDLRAGQLFREHIDEPVTSVAHSPDERFILAGCLDGSIRLIEKANGTEVKSYRGHSVQEYKTECGFSSDGAFVLSGSEDGEIYWWDLVDSKQKHSFVAHSKPVRALACHPESSMFVTGCIDGSAKVWSHN
ncbi:FAD-linked oxidoreductase-like [Phytophthora cactorum]|nr:FAD-linked oxidoreductase-like [Phytophthora cactorum]